MRIDILLKGCFLWSILFLLVACGEMKKPAASVVNLKDCEWYVAPESPLNGGTKNKLDMYALRLYANGSYTFCADLIFETGTWNFDEAKQLMVLKRKTTDGDQLIRYVKDEKLKENKTVFKFYQDYPVTETNIDEVVEVIAVTNKSNNDPYSTSSQTWRNKSSTAETSEQIKERTLSYLQFLEALYTHAIDNNLENAGGKWYPQPVKFYSNKVSMAYADELIEWYNCFYNEAQGIEAYKLLSGALMKVKIAGDDDNIRNLNCVRQMIDIIQKT